MITNILATNYKLATFSVSFQLLMNGLFWLSQKLERANEALAETSHQHDIVVMKMIRLLEYYQQYLWRQLFYRKALPSPEQIMDMKIMSGGETIGK